MTIEAAHTGRADPMVGRDAELVAIDDAVSSERTPVLVLGPPGSGKSRLLEEVLRFLGPGVTVLSACAEPIDLDIPFGVLDRLLGSSPVAEGAATQSDARLSGGPDARFRALDAYLDEISRRGTAGQLLVILDDAQWADSGTIAVLHAALGSSGRAAIGLVAGLRPPTKEATTLERLIDRGRVDGMVLELAPLTATDVAMLAEDRLGAVPGPRLVHALDSAGGNPLILCELLDAMGRSGHLHRRPPGRGATRGDKPVGIDLSDDGIEQLATEASRVLVTRLADVSEAARELVRAASVLDSTFELADVAAILGVPPGSLIGPCRELIETGLLEPTGGRLGFRHDLVRDAVYGDLPEWARTALHRQVASHLADDGTDPVAVARHLHRADPSPSNAVWFERAGHRLLHTDPAAASALLSEASRLQPDPTDELILAHVQSLAWTNRAVEAERVATAHLSSPDGEVTRPWLHFALAQSLTPQGRLAEAATAMFRAGSALLDTDHRARGEQAIAESAIHQAMAFQHDRATERATGLLAVAHTDPIARVIALSARSWAAKTVGRIDDAVRDARSAVDTAGTDVDALRGNPHLFLADALLTGERYDEFEPFAVTARSMAARYGSVWSLPGISAMVTGMHLRRGDWDKAVAEAEAGLSWARDTGNLMAMPWLLSLQSVALLWRGDDADAEALISEADALVNGEARTGAEAVLWARAWWADVHGDDAAALSALTMLWELVLALDVRARMSTIGPELVRAAVRSGDEALARDVTGHLEDLDDQVRSNPAARDACRAIVERDLDLVDASAEHYRAIGLRAENALVLGDGAVIAASDGDWVRASTFAGQAASIHDELGAVGLRRRLERLLPDVEVTSVADHGGFDTRPSTEDPLAALSPAERRIAELVSVGHNNPEIAEALFISRRTVESHLSHVYTKLNIRSRVDLAVLTTANQ